MKETINKIISRPIATGMVVGTITTSIIKIIRALKSVD